MATCESCGGVIGRDCFNPIECAQITHQMEQDDRMSLEQRVESLEQEVAELRRLLLPLDRPSAATQEGQSK